MLPSSVHLYSSRTICYRSVVGLLVKAIGCERVRDACPRGLDKFILLRVVKALMRLAVLFVPWATAHTGPVRVMFDFVDHVPTNSAGKARV